MSYKLLGHPPLHTDEFLASFLLRVSDSNFYLEQSILADLVLANDAEPLDDNLRYPRSVATFEHLSTLTEI